MNCLKMVEVVELEDQYDNMTIDPSTCIVICKSFFIFFLLNFRICNSIINGCMGCYRFIVSLDSHVNCLIIIYKFTSQKKKKKFSLIVFWHTKCFTYKIPLQQTIQI